MSIRSQIVDCMIGSFHEDGVLVARFDFPESFAGFQGHFPDQKVLPGVCQVQCVLVVIEQLENVSASLREIVLTKFIAPIGSGTTISCIVRKISTAGSDTVYKATLSDDEKKVSEIKIRVTLVERKR